MWSKQENEDYLVLVYTQNSLELKKPLSKTRISAPGVLFDYIWIIEMKMWRRCREKSKEQHKRFQK